MCYVVADQWSSARQSCYWDTLARLNGNNYLRRAQRRGAIGSSVRARAGRILASPMNAGFRLFSEVVMSVLIPE